MGRGGEEAGFQGEGPASMKPLISPHYLFCVLVRVAEGDGGWEEEVSDPVPRAKEECSECWVNEQMNE